MIKNVLYVSVVSLSTQTVQLRVKFNQHVKSMTEFASEAVALQAQATSAEVAGEELLAESDADKLETASLEATAEGMKAESVADAAKGAALESQAGEMAELAASEEIEMEAEFGKAAAEDLLAKQELAAAAEMGELAAESSMEAHVDETAVTACQIVPGLDFVCDFVGGIAATALEVTAATEAAESAADFLAAGIAKSKEEADMALGLELQESSASHVSISAEYEGEAASLEEKAEAEELEAEADEVAAKEELAKSTAEQAAAEEQEALAAEDEVSAEKSAQKSIDHGIQAIAVLAWQSLLSLGLMAFFVLRLCFGYLIPSAVGVSMKGDANTLSQFASGTYTMCLAVFSWVLVAVSYDAILDVPNSTERGKRIMEVALFALGLQAIVIHFPSHFIASRGKPTRWLQNTFVTMVDLLLMFGWNIFMCFVLSGVIVHIPPYTVVVAGPILVVVAASYHWHIYKQQSQDRFASVDSLPVRLRSEPEGLTEATSLVAKPKLKTKKVPSNTRRSENKWFKGHHTLLFETLLTSMIVALLWSCLLRVNILWPFIKPAKEAFIAFSSSWKRQFRGLATGVVLLAIGVIAAMLSLSRRQMLARERTAE